MSTESTSIASDLEYVTCPVCGPAPFTVWMDDGKPTRYVRCRSCRTVYASPRTSYAARFAWLDETYGVGDNAFENAARRQPALAVEAAIVQRHVRGGAVLDVGCDIGVFFEWFAGPMWQRFGVEISPSAAAYAARTYSADVRAGTIHQAGYPDAFFDVVTMLDMLYLVDNPRADLQEAARILKPGGVLALDCAGQAYSILRNRGPFCQLLDGRWTRWRTDSGYLFWFSPGGLQRLVEACGFTLIEVHVVGSPVSGSRPRNWATVCHRKALSVGCRLSPRFLTWAPKYLILARRTVG